MKDLTKSLHGSQATRLKTQLKVTGWKGGTLRKTAQMLLFVWLSSGLSTNDHIFVVFLYEGSHMGDNFKEGTEGIGNVVGHAQTDSTGW